MEQKITLDLRIEENIRKFRKWQGLGQPDLVCILQIDNCDMAQKCLVMIECCTQHIQASQLQIIRKEMNTTYPP